MTNLYAERGNDMKGKRTSLKKLVSLAAAGVFLLALVQAVGAKEANDEGTYGPSYPIIWTKPVKAVVFSHKIHTHDAGLQCDSCHNSIFEMAAGTAEKNKDFNMKSIYAGKYCGACHDGTMAFAANTRCTICHVGVKGYNRLSSR